MTTTALYLLSAIGMLWLYKLASYGLRAVLAFWEGWRHEKARPVPQVPCCNVPLTVFAEDDAAAVDWLIKDSQVRRFV